MLLFTIGWVVVGGMLPPMAPSMTPDEVVTFFDDNRVRLRLCMMIVMYANLFLIPFSAVIVAQVARVEGSSPRVWTYTALIGAIGNIIAFILPLMFWNVALFRAERAPELIYLMNDLAWIPFTTLTVPFVALPGAVAIAGLLDRSPQPAFPRWYCYYTIVSTIAVLPAAMVPFFIDGWFAWNNVFAWWLVMIDFFSWFSVTYVVLRKAILAQAGEPAGRAP